MRLFVAVEIAPQVTAAAGDLAADLRARAARLAPHARLTWIPPDRMHLTVRFIGEADAARADAIRNALMPPLPVCAFDLTVHGAGAFPKSGAPRVLWAGLTAGRESLLAVEQVVTERLREAGVPPEARPFSPHLTLARVRDAAGLRSGALLEGLADVPVGTTRVEAITLFESRLSPKGPTYRPDLIVALEG